MITTCCTQINTETGEPQWQPGPRTTETHRCGNPIDPQYYERGPWMCAQCRERSHQRAEKLRPFTRSSFVPMAADVWLYMRDHDVDQDTAVRALGGTP